MILGNFKVRSYPASNLHPHRLTRCAQASFSVANSIHTFSLKSVVLPLKAERLSHYSNIGDYTLSVERENALDKVAKALFKLLTFQLISNQDLFLDVLGSTGTKREAKSYLSRFTPRELASHGEIRASPEEKRLGVSQANLHFPPRAVDESPVFTQAPHSRLVDQITGSLHVALVKIRAPQSINDEVLQGVGHTLAQLTRLGLSCIVVIDTDDESGMGALEACRLALEQGDRVVAAIDQYRGQSARRLDSVIGVAPSQKQRTAAIGTFGRPRITQLNYLLSPLRRGSIPVIIPVGYLFDTQTRVPVAADAVILALTQEFARLSARPISQEKLGDVSREMEAIQRQISLDRIILLDPIGGIPSEETLNGSHVFINLEQEYAEIRECLSRSLVVNKYSTAPPMERERKAPDTISSPSIPVESGTCTMVIETASSPAIIKGISQVISRPAQHISLAMRNLDLLKDSLAILPSSSSAIITTAQEAANSGRSSLQPAQGLGVRTRKMQNLLIHNLLTDKPVISSSLPPMCSQNLHANTYHPVSTPISATFVKRGMPIRISPDPRIHLWTYPTPSSPPLQLSDLPIDLDRLVYLIEDSFNRKLDVDRYLSRTKNRIAGIIIAGDYEGGAIMTWEEYPGSSNALPVPYLDKFAVLQRSQGAGGVADIVFKAVVRDCFPHGVCWRSRKDNPVNKWYFERAKGTWKMPGTDWTMFWTTEGVEIANSTFVAYEGVCKSLVPCWANEAASQ